MQTQEATKAVRGPRVYPEKIPEIGYVRLPTILAHFPVSRSTWFAGVVSGKYPKPVKLGERMTAWRAEEIRALLAQYAGKAAA